MIGFLKENYKSFKEGKHLLQVVFHLDSLDMTQELEDYQLYQMIVEFSETENNSPDEIADVVFRYKFLNCGGKEETPASEIAAFSYLLFTQDAFNFDADCRKILFATGFYKIIQYCSRTDVMVPGVFIKFSEGALGNKLYTDLIGTTDFNVHADAGIEDIIAFTNKIRSREATDDRSLFSFLSSMGINGPENE